MVEQFIKVGIRPNLVPELDLLDGIAVCRALFDSYYFALPGCKEGVLALKSYHKEWDEDKKVYRDKPAHDWSSHYADAFRYMSIARSTYTKPVQDRATIQQILDREVDVRQLNYGFALEDVWNTGPRRSRRV
jgi:hypothetical protein